MKILIKDININYEVSGVGPPLIFLHGWGCSLNTFDNLTKQINEDFTVYQIDLPGFGFSEIKGAYTLDDYANIIYEFCLILAIINPIVVGHSFGGRVAIKYASSYQIHKLVLVSTPGVKQRFNIIKWVKIKTYKLLKSLKININTGSVDYKNSSGYLRGVLVKAVNTDLSGDVINISCPTLLIYGKKDLSVPLYVGEKIKSMINNSGLVVIDGCGHFPYIEKFRHFLIVLKSFISGEVF